MNRLISIVIPTYNRAHDLERALKSVIAQTYSNWEALIVDNHSHDDTDGLVRSFNDPRMQLYKIHNRGVIAASRNLGIQHAKGEYVAFLDSDDWWMPEKLEVSLRYLEQGADVVYHDLYVATRPGQRIFWRKARTRAVKKPVFSDLITQGNALSNSSVVVRKSLLLAIKGLSENKDLIALEDYDAWLRIAQLTEKFNKIGKTLGYYWAGGGNVSNASKTIKSLSTLEERYAEQINKMDVCSGYWWLYYSKGRAYYKSGSHELARRTLSRIYWMQAPLAILLKTLWMRMVLKLLRRPDTRPQGI